MRPGPASFVAVAVLVAVASNAAARDPSVDAALAMLGGDRSPKVRAQAALTLRAAGEEPDVRTGLLAALGDGDAIVRAAAANALGAVPHTDAFEALSRAARDRDPLVVKWAGWALRRTMASAPTVRVADVKVEVTAPGRSEELARVFEGALLGVLLANGGRFEIDRARLTMDFSSEGEKSPQKEPEDESPDDRKMLELMRQGKFDAAALAAGEGESLDAAPVTVRLLADIDARDAANGALARARLRATTTDGVVAWEVTAEGAGRPPVIPEGERDEYTTDPRPEDLRKDAVDAAGLAAARALVAGMKAPESPPGSVGGRTAR